MMFWRIILATNKKDHTISFCIDSALKKGISQKLKKYRMNLSEYIRFLIMMDLSDTEDVATTLKSELQYLGVLTLRTFKATLRNNYSDTITDDHFERLFAEELENIKNEIS